MLNLLLIALVTGYLLGSLPFGFLVARAKGVNIFAVGSKNPGATNVRRVLGHGAGNLVLFLDLAKGAAAAGWPLFGSGSQTVEAVSVAGLVAAILGHSFSCFTGWRGGKSVATAAGGFAVLFPGGILIAAIVFGLTLAISRYVSLASMLGASSLVVSALALQRSLLLVVVSAGVAGFVILRHRANLARLVAGTESKVGRREPAADSAASPPKA